MTGLIEQIARAIIISSAGERAADHAQEFDTGNWANAKRAAQAVLPFIAAENERCARVAENHSYSIDIGTWAAMTKKEHGAYACHSVAAAIRSKP